MRTAPPRRKGSPLSPTGGEGWGEGATGGTAADTLTRLAPGGAIHPLPPCGRGASTRRAFFTAAVVPLLVAGCGWEPLYADRESGPADAELSAIRVAPIPERIGQHLAWAMRESLNPTGIATPQRYLLRITLQAARSDLGVQVQGFGTRGRLDVAAGFFLNDIASNKQLLSGGSHVAESFDILANEYSNLVAEEDARTRAVEQLRREITSRLIVFMQRQVAQGAAKP